MTSIGSPNPNFKTLQAAKTKPSKENVDNRSSKQEQPQGTLHSFLKFVDTFTRPFRHSEDSSLANSSFKKVADLFVTPLPGPIKDIIKTIESKFTEPAPQLGAKEGLPSIFINASPKEFKPLFKTLEQHIQSLTKESETWTRDTPSMSVTTTITHAEPEFIHNVSSNKETSAPPFTNMPKAGIPSNIPLSINHLFEQPPINSVTTPELPTKLTPITKKIIVHLNTILQDQKLPIEPITLPLSQKQLTPFNSVNLSSIPENASKNLRKDIVTLATINHSTQPTDTTPLQLKEFFNTMLTLQNDPVIPSANELTTHILETIPEKSLQHTIFNQLLQTLPLDQSSTLLSEIYTQDASLFIELVHTNIQFDPTNTPITTLLIPPNTTTLSPTLKEMIDLALPLVFTASPENIEASITPLFLHASTLDKESLNTLTSTVLNAVSNASPHLSPDIKTEITNRLAKTASEQNVLRDTSVPSSLPDPSMTQLQDILSSIPSIQNSNAIPSPKETLTHVITTIPDPIIQATVLDQLIQLNPTHHENTIQTLLINPRTNKIELPTPLLEHALTQLPTEQASTLLLEIKQHDSALFSSLLTTALQSPDEGISIRLPLTLLLNDLRPSSTEPKQLINAILPLVLEAHPEKADAIVLPIITASIMLDSESFKYIAKDLFITILDTTPENISPLFSSITSLLSEKSPEKLSLFLDALGPFHESIGMNLEKNKAESIMSKPLSFESTLNQLSDKERPIALQFINLVTSQDTLDPTTTNQFITQGLSLIDNLDSHPPSRHLFQLGLHEVQNLELKGNELKHSLMSLAQLSNASAQLKNTELSQLVLTLIPQLTQKSETTPSALAGLRGLAVIAKHLPGKSDSFKTSVSSALTSMSSISEGKVLNHSIFALGRLLTHIPEKSQDRFLTLLSSFTDKETVIFTLKLSNLSSKLSPEKLMDLLYTFEHLQDLNKISSKEILNLVSLFSKQHNIDDVNDEVFLLANSTAVLEKTLNPESLEKNKLLLNELAISTVGSAIFGAEDAKVKKLISENNRQLKGLLMKNDSLTKAYLALFGGIFNHTEIDDVTGGFADWKSLLASIAQKNKEDEEKFKHINKKNMQKERSDFLLNQSKKNNDT